MALHFTDAEFDQRKAATLAAMEAASLDGLLCFRPESHYWLTGFDTFGYVFFQCLYLGADGRVMLLTRAPDLRQAQLTSTIKDIRIWEDRDGANPAEELREILRGFGLAGKRLGVEYEAYGLTGRNAKRLDAAFESFAVLDDASDLISRLRCVKSPAEIAYVRKAAALADDAWEAALPLVGEGAFEGDILSAMQGAVFAGGGDYSGNESVIGSGPNALLCRYQTGRRHLAAGEQLTLEWAGVYRRYHAAMMRTLRLGPAPAEQQRMAAVATEAIAAVEEALTPGRPVGEAFEAHAEIMDKAGYRAHRMNACGYSLGTTFAPNWMDWPMLYRANPVIVEPGMVFFVHMILFDSERGLAMSPGRTSLITERGAEVLSRLPLDFVCR